MKKFEMILQIVDWEHRYLDRELHSGDWVIGRIRELSNLNKEQISKKWSELFGIQLDPELTKISSQYL